MNIFERPVYLSKLFSYVVDSLKAVAKLKSINNICSQTIIYYSGEMWDINKKYWLDVAEIGNVDMMIGLINSGIDINMQNDDGDTALICAAREGKDKCVEILCKKGADINMQNKFRNTALICAALKGKEKCVEILCKKGHI